ncbi:UNVERIFIED_CONTAM: hypothetical protein FKN15_065814 [Acipenser sinensis]
MHPGTFTGTGERTGTSDEPRLPLQRALPPLSVPGPGVLPGNRGDLSIHCLSLPQKVRYPPSAGVPAHIHRESLAGRILKLPGVLAIHELHVWQLSESYTVALAHIHCSTAGSFPDLAVEIKELFRSVGVHSSTVQPEFSPRLPQTEQMQSLCQLASGKECVKKLCCQ